MEFKLSKCGFSPLNLIWSASSPRSRPKRRSIATPALKPKTRARRWTLAGEYASARATTPAPSAPASRFASCMLASAVLRHLGRDQFLQYCAFPTSQVCCCQAGVSLRPTWRSRLRAVHVILRIILAVASLLRRSGIRDIFLSTQCFMMSALFMCKRRAFPSASVSAITARELTSGNTTRTASFTLLVPSHGLAETVFRMARRLVRYPHVA